MPVYEQQQRELDMINGHAAEQVWTQRQQFVTRIPIYPPASAMPIGGGGAQTVSTQPRQ